MVEVESGSNFLRNFQESVEGVNLTLGVEHVGVVQSYGGLFADGGKKEQVVFVEGSAVCFIDELDDAHNIVFLAQGRAHPGLYFEIAARLQALRKRGLLRRIFD